MRVMVTGCAGFIGSHLSESLLEDGVEVLGIDCFNDNYSRPQKLRNLERARSWNGFDFVPVDLAHGGLEDLVADVEGIFHLAAEPGVRSSWGGRFESYLRNNVLATQRLLEAARAEAGRRFVYASSSSVYGQAAVFPTPEDALPAPRSPYGTTKLAGEHLAGLYHANHAVDVVSLRYFSVYGPRQRPDMAFTIFGRAMFKREPIRLFGGDQTRDFTYVGDIVRATREAADTAAPGGTVLNVGGGSRVSLREAIGVLEDVAGVTAAVECVGEMAGDVLDTSADCSRARALIGYRPQATLAEGLAAQWDWIVSEAAQSPR